MVQPPDPQPDAEELFADYLDQLEAGQSPDFVALCAEHPAQAARLQRLHTRWRAMSVAFETIANDRSPEPTQAPSGQRPAAEHDRYALREEIARGAMGRIVRAFDRDLRRDVALKVLRGPLDDARQQRRFLEEAQIAAQLDHPGIVPIHELGLDAEGRPFFSMQLVRGRDLGAILTELHGGADTEHEWTRTRVLHVLLRAAEAMAFAHGKGVVHRDLKPANIMVGSFGETYVMDWGLAHVQHRGFDHRPLSTLATDLHDAAPDSPLLTRDGDVVGTPAYMAPEQAAGGPGAAAPAIDVYALGAMLYHLLAGRMPYADDGSDRAEQVLQRLRQGPPAPLPEDVPAELRAVCERAMARSADQRYPDMQALAADLRAFLELRTVSAYATGRFAELRKWIARNRMLTAASALLLLALLTGSIAVTGLWVQAEQDRDRADRSADRLRTELARSAFRSARQRLLLENSREAADALWHAHFAGYLPRATDWALRELAARDPYLATVPERADYQPVAFAPALDAVLVGGADGRLQVRSATTLALQLELGDAGQPIECVCTIGDGGEAIAGTRGGELLHFDLRRGVLRQQRRPHSASARHLLATGGTSFVSGGGDGRVLWFDDPAAEPHALLQLPAGVNAMATRPGGTGIMVADEQGRLRGCDRNGSWSFSRDWPGLRPTALVFGDDARQLWFSGTDHHLHRIDTKGELPDQSWPTRNGTGRQLARAADGSILLGGWWRTARFAADGTSLPTVALRSVSRLAYDAASQRLLTSSSASGIGLVDVSDHARRRLPGSGGIALSADGARAAVFDGAHAVVHEVDSGRVITRIDRRGAGWLQLDRDGSHLALVQRTPARVTVIDIAAGSERWQCDGPVDIPFADCCVFAPSADQILVRVGSDRVRRLRTDDGELLAEYHQPGARLTRCAWSADSRWFATIQRTRTLVRRHEVATGAVQDIDLLPATAVERDIALAAVALSDDGSRLAGGTWHGTVFVRDERGQQQFAAHAGTIWSLQFASDDRDLLFSSGGAQGLALWDLESGECCYQALDDVTGLLQLSADGNTLACLPGDGPLLLDLGYHRRHVAGNLEYHLSLHPEPDKLPAARIAALRDRAAATMVAPWPRFR